MKISPETFKQESGAYIGIACAHGSRTSKREVILIASDPEMLEDAWDQMTGGTPPLDHSKCHKVVMLPLAKFDELRKQVTNRPRRR